MTEKGRNRLSNSAKVCWIVLLLLSAAAAVYADADENGYAVLIEQSPIHAGTVNPGLGVHKGEVGSTMTLTAMPRPGYRFLYWLGDVSNPSSMATEVQIDAPKIVVAVYERDEFELPLPEVDEGLLNGAPRGGGARRAPLAVGNNSGMFAFYPDFDYSPFRYQRPILPEQEDDDLFPVPENGFPVPGENTENPIPEPTALCLLAAGSILLRLRRVSG